MAEIEERLYAKLTATAAVTALVATRIYPQVAVQDVSGDYVTYDRISGMVYQSHEGPDGLERARVSFLCHSTRYANAKAIARAIQTALDGFNGNAGGGDVQGCLCVANEDAPWDPDTRRYVAMVDFMAHYAP